MCQFSKVLLPIDKVHTVPQNALDCGPGLGGLNQVYGPNVSAIYVTPSSMAYSYNTGLIQKQDIIIYHLNTATCHEGGGGAAAADILGQGAS